MAFPHVRIIHTRPDNLGRVVFTDRWYDDRPPYCGECGADPRRSCGHYGPHYRGQVFFAPPCEVPLPPCGIVVVEGS